MNKYLEAEKRLAELLGWTDIELRDDGNAGGLFFGKRNTLYAMNVPPWARSNAAAFALMVEHDCYPIEFGGFIGINSSLATTCVDLDDHPDKKAAVRYAIVMAVIAKLEAQRPG